MHTNKDKPMGGAQRKRMISGAFAKETIALFILVIIWAFFMRHAFTASRSFTMYMDNEFFLGTVLSSMSDTFAHGEWPMRMQTLLGGVPLYNFAQLSPFYPFYLPMLPIFRTPLDAALSMHWMVLGHILLYQFNSYFFLRVLRASRLASVAGASLVAFNANSLAYSSWLNITAPYAWMPLFLAGLVGILEGRSALRYAGIALIGIIMLVLASPAQPLIHAIYLSIIFVGFAFAWNATHEKKHVSLKVLWILFAVAVVAVLLTAPVTIPVALGMKGMIRWIGALPPVVGNARIPYSAFEQYQLSLADLGGIFFQMKPGAVGSQYVGLFTIVLALIAVVSRPRSWVVRSLAAIAVYSLVSAAGSNLGLLTLNYHLPLLNKIREATRFLVLFQFSAAILAAIGIDELATKGPAIGRWGRLNIQMFAAGAAGVAALATAFLLRGRILNHASPAVTILALCALMIATIVLSKKSKDKMPIAASLWAAAAIASLAAEVSWTPPPIAASQYLTSDGPALDRALARVAAMDPSHRYKVIFGGNIPDQEAGMLASYRGVKALNFYFNPAPYDQFREMYDQGSHPGNYFRIIGARYLICKDCSAELTQGFTYRESVSGYDLYEDPRSFPDFFVDTHVDGTYTDLNDFVSKTAGPNLSGGVLYLDANSSGDKLGISSNSTSTKNCSASEGVNTPNDLRFLVTCTQSGVLIVNQYFEKAWLAYVDLSPAKVLKINENQIGVPFTSGAHLVALRYRPRVFLVSLILMSIGLTAIFSFVIFSSIQKTWPIKKLIEHGAPIAPAA